MNLQLKRIRESKKISQKQMAEQISKHLGKEVKTRTYGSWERQEATMNLEQAYYCAVILGCTLNDLVDMSSENDLTRDEREIVETYRSVTVHGKSAIKSNVEWARTEFMPKSNEVDKNKKSA